MNMRTISGWVFSFVILSSASVWAQENEAESQNSSDYSTYANVSVFSGGIGDDEINYIKTVQHQYDVKMLFTEASGAFLSDMPVTITNSHGKTVLSTVTKGPVLLVNLPEGSYTVSAIRNDVTRDQKISVTGHVLRVYQFRFPAKSSDTSDRYDGN